MESINNSSAGKAREKTPSGPFETKRAKNKARRERMQARRRNDLCSDLENGNHGAKALFDLLKAFGNHGA